MGHVRLGRLPKNKTWEGILDCLNMPESSLEDIIRVSLREIKKVFIESKVTDNLARCFGIYATLAEASRSSGFDNALQGLGIDTSTQSSGIRLLDSISSLAEDRDRITILDQIAVDSFRETMLSVIEDSSTSLFGCTIDTVQKAFKQYSTPVQIGKLGHQYFSTYIYKAISYALDKELANCMQENGRFRHTRDIQEFHAGVRQYCFEMGRYVEGYSADWYSKHLFHCDISDQQKVKDFTSYAMNKMLLEFIIEEGHHD
jgi:hypothetical protein